METTLLSLSTPSSKSRKPMPLCRLPTLHMFLPYSRYKHTFYCVSACCVIQTHSVCFLTQIIYWLRCILCVFAITSVDLHTLFGCYICGMSCPRLCMSSYCVDVLYNLETFLYSPCTVAPSGGTVHVVSRVLHKPPGDHGGNYFCRALALV